MLIAAGGTGGHIYPALSIGKIFRRNGWKVIFAGRKDSFEEQVYRSNGFTVKNVRSSLLDFSLISAAGFSVNLIKGVKDAFKIMLTENPDAVLGGGGYVSAPVLLAAHILRAPYFVYEQNIIPGRTNRIFANGAKSIFTGFPDLYGSFKPDKTVFSGNPVRPELLRTKKEEGLKYFGFSGDLPVLLVFGGSAGAAAINEIFVKLYERLAATVKVQVIFITGRRDFTKVSAKIGNTKTGIIKVFPYFEKMEFAYAAADFAISRAGAMTLTELALTGTFGIVIPFPFARDNHQFKNALYLKGKGCVDIISQKELTEEILLNKIVCHLQDMDIFDKIKCKEAFPPNGAEVIYKTITEKVR